MKKWIWALILLTAAALTAVSASAASYTGIAITGNRYDLEVGDKLYITNPYSPSSYDLVLYAYTWSVSDGNVISLSSYGGSSSTTVTAEGPGVATVYGELDGSVEVKTPQIRYNSVTGKKETYYIITHSAREYLGTATIVVRDTLPPEITAQPANASAPSGQKVTTSVTAEDHSSLSYQWYVKDPGKSFVKSSITAATYGCTMKESISGRQVYCVITDSEGNQTTSNTATLSLLGITQQPKNAVAEIGTAAKTTLKAEGEGLTYQWYIAKKGSSSFSKSSITSPTYSIKISDSNTGRQAYCVVTNKYGQSVRSDTVTLRKPVEVKITTQPQSKFAADGKTVSTTLKAQGDGLTYQWYYKNAGASKFSKASITGPTYSVKMDASRSGRQIYCVVTDKFGDSVKSKTVTIARFAIVKQPADAYADLGKRAATSVTAEGDGLKYQWYIKAPGGSTFTKSSITGNTYSYIMTKAKDGRQVYCVITDKYGNTLTTKTVTLRISNYAVIHAQTATLTADSGSKVAATVEATGDGLTYQWYIKSPTGTTFTKSSITGKTYSYDMTKAKSGRQAYCIVSDLHGNTLKSKTFTFSLLAITDHTDSRTAGEGKKVTAGVKAVGDGLQYQWYFKNAGAASFSKSSVTSANYGYAMTSAKSGRQAYCVVTDKWGNSVKSSTFTFSLLKITQQPSGQPAGDGETACTSVTAIGDGLKYQWYVRDEGADEFTQSSLTNKTYSMTMTQELSSRQVYCVVTDKWGNSVQSNTATLSLLGITTQPEDITTCDLNLQVTKVICYGSGLTYQWYATTDDDPNSFEPADNINSADNYFQRSISESAPYYKGYCVITDRYGNSIKSNVFTWRWFGFKKGFSSKAYGPNNSTKTLTVEATGEGKITYEWYIKHPEDEDFTSTGVTDSSYTHTITAENSGAQIKCRATNSRGDSIWSTVCTLSRMELIKDIKEQYSGSGPISITVEAIGDDLQYQWYITYGSSLSSNFDFLSDSNGGKTPTMSWSLQSGKTRYVYCQIRDAYGNYIRTTTALLSYRSN